MVRVNCDQCSQSFSTKRLYVSHLISKSCHKSIREAAKSQARNKAAQEESFEYPTLEIVPVQDCLVCRVFSKPGMQMYMLGHLANHVRDKGEYFMCDVCGLKFESGYFLEKHENKKHKNEKCEECPKKFKIVPLLQKHVEDVHRTEKCMECEFSTKTTSDLERHVYLKHPKDICEECGMVFEDESAVVEHYKEIHEKMKCDDCNKEYDTEELLDDHRVRVHNHSKTTFKEFGGGLMMMMISETCESSEMEVEDEENENSKVLEKLAKIEEQPGLSDPEVNTSEESNANNEIVDGIDNSEEGNGEMEIENNVDLEQSENKNINVFGTGFFMMYKEDSEEFTDEFDEREPSDIIDSVESSEEKAVDTCELLSDSKEDPGEVVVGDSFKTNIEESGIGVMKVNECTE